MVVHCHEFYFLLQCAIGTKTNVLILKMLLSNNLDYFGKWHYFSFDTHTLSLSPAYFTQDIV